MEAALAAFDKLKLQGKVDHYGINGLGDTETLYQIIEWARGHCAILLQPDQPKAAVFSPAGFPFQTTNS